MDIIIQSLGFKAGEALESFIREKVSVLNSDEIVRANVTLFKGPASTVEQDYCEIRLEVPGNDHFVKKHSLHFEVAVTECLDVLTEMLNKAKHKNMDRRQAEAIEIQNALMDAGEELIELDEDIPVKEWKK